MTLNLLCDLGQVELVVLRETLVHQGFSTGREDSLNRTGLLLYMRVLVLPVLLAASMASAQGLQPILLAELPSVLSETSGLLVVDGQVWTHGDSGTPNRLYRIDPSSGDVLRELEVTNATNVDWEDLTTDGEWVYVGDFGNNSGARTDLRIYRFPLAQLLDPTVTSVLVDTIRFAYADQSDFTPAYQANNRDCEAFIAHNDSLHLFTKNWLDFRSHHYVLPAQPGDHLAQPRDTLDALGLITGAAWDVQQGVLALLGYTVLMQPFVWRFSDFPGTAFFHGLAHRHDLALSLTQAEALAWEAPDTLLFTNEAEVIGNARLWRLPLGVDAQVGATALDQALVLVPDPARDTVRITGLKSPAWLSLRDDQGVEVLHRRVGADGQFSVAMLAAGLYFVEVEAEGRPVLLRLSVLR
jgi:hypothetical protein